MNVDVKLSEEQMDALLECMREVAQEAVDSAFNKENWESDAETKLRKVLEVDPPEGFTI